MTLRPVGPGEIVASPASDAAHAIVAEAVSNGARTFLIAWETAGREIEYRTTPPGYPVERGMIEWLHETLHPAE